MTFKLIFIAIIVINAIAGMVAKWRAEQKRREEERRMGPSGSEAGRGEGGESADAAPTNLGDLFDIFKDDGAVRPEPPPPLGSDRLAQRERPTPTATGPVLRPMPTQPSAPPRPIAQPSPDRGQRPPIAAKVPAPPTTGVGRAAAPSSQPARRGMSDRERENARRAAAREASRKARQARSAERRGARGSVADRPSIASPPRIQKGPVAAKPAPVAANERPSDLGTAGAVRKALSDPRRVRTAFVVSEILRPPLAG